MSYTEDRISLGVVALLVAAALTGLGWTLAGDHYRAVAIDHGYAEWVRDGRSREPVFRWNEHHPGCVVRSDATVYEEE